MCWKVKTKSMSQLLRPYQVGGKLSGGSLV